MLQLMLVLITPPSTKNPMRETRGCFGLGVVTELIEERRLCAGISGWQVRGEGRARGKACPGGVVLW